MHTFLQCRELLRQGQVITVKDLEDLPQEARIGWGGGLGTPEVGFQICVIVLLYMLTSIVGCKRKNAW
jgi:hypothetical protein